MSNDEIDVNKVAVELITQNIEKFYSRGKGIFKEAADQLRLKVFNSYKGYSECISERYTKTKSFFFRNEPANIYDFYVGIGISSSTQAIEHPTATKIFAQTNNLVITGSGGSGKSILMRHLLLTTFSYEGKVPVFLELRELNESKLDLLNFIYETLQSNHFNLDEDFIKKGLKAGHFVLYCDGFDELSRPLRKIYSQQIKQFAKKYDQNCIVVSSRPDDEFSGWTDFSTFVMKPLTLDQAYFLVEKLPFDANFKIKFLNDLKTSLFEKHHSFLSNPLLLSIMLLTYGLSADIPEKLNIFYDQAYEALFQRHDALKGAFVREHSTNLNIQDFAKVFAAFSIQTYDKRAFQFSRSQATDTIDKAKRLTSLEFNSMDYLSDAIQSTCLLVEEGLTLVFSHRSFQEYFAALFICDSRPEVQKKLLAKYAPYLDRDIVIKLISEMKSELVEREIIIPFINRLEQQLGVKRKVTATQYLKFLKASISSILIQDERLLFAHKSGSDNKYVSFIIRNYGNLVGWSGFDTTVNQKNQQLKDKYKALGLRSIEVRDLNNRSEFYRDLVNTGGYHSPATLELIFKIREALVAKHQATEVSLEELLKV